MALTAVPIKQILILIIAILPLFQASNILVIPLHGEGSHYSVMATIARELANRDHNITILVGDTYKQEMAPKQNPFDHQTRCGRNEGNHFHFEFFESMFTREELAEYHKQMAKTGLEGRKLTSVQKSFINRTVFQRCRSILDTLSKLRADDYKLIIVDLTLKCALSHILNFRQKLDMSVAAVSATLAVPSPDEFNNMPEITSVFDQQLEPFIQHSLDITQSLFGYDSLPCLGKHDADLYLVNTNSVLDSARPLTSNTIAVGGLTTRPAKKLPEEWLSFVESPGTKGVVLFSLGTYANGMDDYIMTVFSEAFAQLPYNVVWKLNGQAPANISSNVKVADWIPQNDLLGHPNTKVFVNHCGLNGIWEAIYHGVPMVALPLFGDQYDNAQRIASKEIGMKLAVSTLTIAKLVSTIRIVINDQKFRNNAQHLSGIFRNSSLKHVELAADQLERLLQEEVA